MNDFFTYRCKCHNGWHCYRQFTGNLARFHPACLLDRQFPGNLILRQAKINIYFFSIVTFWGNNQIFYELTIS